MTITATEIAAPLTRYARRLHAVAGPGHHVASPLGAWLLLALCARTSEGKTREILNATLGCDPAGAADLAATLLARPHPLVPAGAAVWHHDGVLSDRQEQWLAGLPADVQAGPVPDQAEADDWARRHTFGLIDRFPVSVGPAVYLLAATVLATRVSWERPFEVVAASALGPSSPWASELTRVLRTPDGPEHERFIAVSETAGDVAVHAAWARGGLLVTSVAAAPEVPAGDVLTAAYEVATALAAGGQAAVARRSLFDLPLGDGPLWTVSERSGPVKAAGGREEQCTAVLPAWSARSELDLTDPSLGFAAVAEFLAPGDPWQAKQAAMARYHRVGFEAAAVSGIAVALAMRVPRPGLIRTAELRFGHPYAVVAVTVDQPGRSSGTPGPWNGLPVFSAWVAQPENAEPENAEPENG